MLALLWRFLFLASLYFLLIRVVRALFGVGRRSRSFSERAAPQRAPGSMVRDPVCGMYLDPTVALKAGGGRTPLYFCSDDCRRKFLAGSAPSAS
jgi:YHS domain-containing protein